MSRHFFRNVVYEILQPTQQDNTKKHDKQSTTKHTNDSRPCNCRSHNQCPMQGNCLQANVVYKADITATDNNETKTYIGVTANEFKTRFRNHTKSINSKKYQNETELSKYIWQLRDSNRPHKIKWGIIKKITSCKSGQSRCGLCPEEKLLILKGRNQWRSQPDSLVMPCKFFCVYRL